MGNLVGALKPASLLQHEMLADVAVGSITSFFTHLPDVRFTPNSGEKADVAGRLKCAIHDIPRRNKTQSFHLHLLLDLDRERDEKRGALTDRRFQPDLAAVHLDDAL